jgi:importin subunit beta-1
LAERISANDTDAPTYSLSPFFDVLISTLLGCAQNKMIDSGMKATVYEAIAALVSTCALDCFLSVQRLATEMLRNLDATIQMQVRLNKILKYNKFIFLSIFLEGDS